MPMLYLLRLEKDLAADRLSCVGLPMSDPQAPTDAPAYRRNALHDLEAVLSKARIAAEAIDHRTLAFFIDMAIAEVKSGLTGDDERSE